MLHIAKKEEKAKTQQLCSKELSDGWMAGLTGNESLDRQLMRNLNLDQDLGWGLVATDGQLILDTAGWLVVSIMG